MWVSNVHALITTKFISPSTLCVPSTITFSGEFLKSGRGIDRCCSMSWLNSGERSEVILDDA